MAASRQPTSIEFVVKPREDLYLEGSLRTLPRVAKGEPYPCQMQKTQTFSCLFRHYAKHNGLRKEDLVFYFVDELLPDQMPETVHLMPQDEIWVEHRQRPGTKVEKKPEVSPNVFSRQFRTLMNNGWHSDITFILGESREEIVAHRAILCARCEYFEAMFKPGGMRESTKTEIEMVDRDPKVFRRMLEFIYTAEVEDIEECTAPEIFALLEMSNEYLLNDLGILCEHAAAKIINLENIGKFMLLCARLKLEHLREVCLEFVAENRRTLRLDEGFRQEIEQSPELGLLILDAMNDDESGSGKRGSSNKRRRITDGNSDLEVVPGQPGGANTIAPNNGATEPW